MTTVSDILTFLDSKAPMAGKMGFDNVGLLVGRGQAPVRRVLVSLDITGPVIREAADWGAELIVSHHPLFFELKAVSDAAMEGELALSLAEKGIAAICMHTNLDAAQGGVNDALMAALGGTVTGVLEPDTRIGRIGELPEEMAFGDFLRQVKAALAGNGLRYHDAGRPVKHLAVCGGSGGGDIGLAAAAGCDTFVTADIKYHQFLEAAHVGVNLIDADHFSTENVVTPVLRDWLQAAFPEAEVRLSRVHGQTARFFC